MTDRATQYVTLVDARQRNWLPLLKQIILDRRSAVLVLPGGRSAAQWLEKLFGIALHRNPEPHDRVTLYEFSRSLDQHNYRALWEAQDRGDLMVLIEELYFPRQRSKPGMALLCSVVCRIGPGISFISARRPEVMEFSLQNDYLEAEVYIGEFNEAAFAQIESEQKEATTEAQVEEYAFAHHGSR